MKIWYNFQRTTHTLPKSVTLRCWFLKNLNKCEWFYFNNDAYKHFSWRLKKAAVDIEIRYVWFLRWPWDQKLVLRSSMLCVTFASCCFPYLWQCIDSVIMGNGRFVVVYRIYAFSFFLCRQVGPPQNVESRNSAKFGVCRTNKDDVWHGKRIICLPLREKLHPDRWRGVDMGPYKIQNLDLVRFAVFRPPVATPIKVIDVAKVVSVWPRLRVFFS